MVKIHAMWVLFEAEQELGILVTDLLMEFQDPMHTSRVLAEQ